MTEPLDFALISRLRDVLRDREAATETDLRTLSEQGDAWQRTLLAQIGASERRLEQLTARPDTALHEIAAELRRIDELRPQLIEVKALLGELERRARELRTEWLSRQAGLL